MSARSEVLRAQLEADPSTRSIAKTLGLPVEEYVEKVLDYALNPRKTPQFTVVPDEVSRANGAATTAEVVQWLEGVAAGRISLRPQREQDVFEGSAGI